MKVKVKKDQLSKILSRTQNIVSRKSTMPILSNVLIESEGNNLIVSATDLEVSLTCRIPAEGNGKTSVCTNARSLFDVVKELPTEEVTLGLEKEKPVTIESGKASFQILTADPEEFPQLPKADSSKSSVFPAKVLSEMIGKIYYAMSTDEMRYNLNGVFLETIEEKGAKLLRMVATDGHRLSMIDREIKSKEVVPLKKGVILPRKGVLEMRNLLEGFDGDVKLAVSESNAILEMPETTLFMRLVSGDFPNYRQVIPKDNDKKMTVSKDELRSTLRRVSVLSSGKTKCVKFEFKGDVVELSSSNPEMGEAREELSIKYEGDPLTIGFNARYFMDVLDVASSDDVTVEMKTELTPGLVKFEDDEYFMAAIMPMRI